MSVYVTERERDRQTDRLIISSYFNKNVLKTTTKKLL